VQDQRIINTLFPSHAGQLQQGYEGLGALFGWGPGTDPGGPPPGPPPGQPAFPPTGPGLGPPPWQPGGQQGPPPGPPPGTPPIGIGTQTDGIGVFAVDPGAFRRCINRYTFVRLDSGRRFWFWPTFIGRRSVAGYRWRPRQYRWVYMGIDAERIRSFECR